MTKRHKTAMVAVLLVLAMKTGGAFCLPEVREVESGTAEIQIKDQNTMTITASANAVINYSSFNIMQNESVVFYTPMSTSTVLNRVVTPTPSQILGSLSSNGIIILVNESGIYVGPQASINTAGLILSTRDITNQRFLSGEYVFQRVAGDGSDRVLINDGKITVIDGGFGVLIAGAIENNGVITARIGTIALASGNAVRLELAGNKLISVIIEEPVAKTIRDFQGNPITDQIKNTGTLSAEGGTVILKAESINDVFTKVINLRGIVEARRVESREGKVVLAAGGYTAIKSEIRATNIVIGDASQGATPAEVDIEEGSCVKGEESVAITAINVINIDSTIEAPTVTLVSGDAINTKDMAIIQGTNVSLTAHRFGRSETPVTINADNIYIKRTNGDIGIRQSIGIGTSVMITGPPEDDSFGAILYNKDASQLMLVGDHVIISGSDPTYLFGNITFSSLICTTPSKFIYFQAGKTYTILGELTIRGAEGSLIEFLSSQEGAQWYINPRGSRDISYVLVKDSNNISPAEIMTNQSTNRGNCYNWDAVRTWTGASSTDSNWTTPANWGGIAPVAGDDLVFPDGAARMSNSNDFVAGTGFASIQFSGISGGYTLGGNQVALGVGNITSDNTSGTNTINLAISMAATRTITVTNSGGGTGYKRYYIRCCSRPHQGGGRHPEPVRRQQLYGP